MNETSPYTTPALKKAIKEKNTRKTSQEVPLTLKETYQKYGNSLESTLKPAKSKYF